MSSRTISVSIARPPAAVYAYLADPANFPRWSKFITAIRKDGAEWVATTPERTVRIRFCPRNELGVVDHWVMPEPGASVYVPLRVLAQPDGNSEVNFTVFRLPGINDAAYDEDIRMVRTDLDALKRVLESER